MKIQFAAAAAIALLASAPCFAATVHAGLAESEACSRAAAHASTASRFELRNAIPHCDGALSGDLSQNDRAATLVNRGILKAAAGNGQAARADYNAALERNPRLAAAYMNRGTLELRDERYQEARADFDQALSLGTANAHVAYFNRAGAKEAMGDMSAAYRDYRKAQELAPDFQPARTELTRFQVVPRRTADNR
jgi:tetratricopeptide (TPR) repeat protein